MALSNFNNAFTKPSQLKAAILLIRLIRLIEANVIAIKIWFTPNLVALCHTVGKKVLMDLTIFWRFIYFATVLRPEYFVMLQPVNEDLITFDWFFNFFFVFSIWEVMFFC
jgi:hypothetical protein